MAKKKVSRKELLKTTDEFLSLTARTILFIRNHSQHFSYIGMGIAALILIYLGINTYLNHMNKKAQEAYNKAYYAINKAMVPEADEKAMKEAETLFREVIEDYGLSKVSRLVPPELAYLKFREKEYDKTIALYQQYLPNTPEGSPYRALAWLALAACHEEKGEYSKAVENLNNILSKGDALFKDQAMLSLARVYRLSGEREKAKQVLEKFVDQYADSPYLPLVEAQLKQ